MGFYSEQPTASFLHPRLDREFFPGEIHIPPGLIENLGRIGDFEEKNLGEIGGLSVKNLGEIWKCFC